MITLKLCDVPRQLCLDASLHNPHIMGDEETRCKILATSDPRKIKALGREVKNYDERRWQKYRFCTVVLGNLHKFEQNPELRDFLLFTDNKVIVEASPYDTIWGIGCSADSIESKNPKLWKGTNLLGFALMQVRDKLKK